MPALSPQDLATSLSTFSDHLYTYVLAVLLVAVGLYFTARTRAVQVRHLGAMVRSITSSRSGAEGGISSFQAFAVGLAARVGIGNVAGVAIAVVAGGPGALFWMWVVALVGMATSFAESTLAQVFKERGRDFTFHGGPAFYIKNGLGSRAWGAVFAAICIVSVGVTVVMVQTNALAGVVHATVASVSPWMVGVALVLLVLPVVLGGLKGVARVTEVVAPLMALVYVLVTLVVMVMNATELPAVLVQVVKGAFGVDSALFGVAGGLVAAVLNGVRRGLFSNEAGLGTVPNAAGTATVAHPVQQGLIQSFGVFVDTILVCSATGFLILLATGTYQPGKEGLVGAVLTQQAVVEHLGAWTTWPMVVLIFVLVFSTVLGCYSYSQVNVNYLGGERRAEQALGLLLTAAAFAGTVLDLPVVWALTDIALGFLGLINLVVVLLLSRWVLGALRDWEAQRAAGTAHPVFHGHGNPLLPGDTADGVWED
ncbi:MULTISPECIES: amino acid carrier protein [unclassified Actinomyces]|uniref:alanine/glycine:cation symporter family protein n=1 Tax=unclassified Actinomyces TaxID=2609248 RepID=UPI0020180D30|nr:MULTISPECIES: amino acid carrier protein [unclassified Actinomyces]MCL3776743.1 sodium:alanine symporter family protein [Actinomyces sp. AC-20-1]MCL3789697.1 sodium:alanine symporter family protein [Actinomyces sp. 187325]MCL3791882.1 sodium:alanine symporter family protein [Actinomyces sp. 186855]MCL3794457.1 sodium:alanine symporter family protein [Actinomyces sp. 217892]